MAELTPLEQQLKLAESLQADHAEHADYVGPRATFRLDAAIKPHSRYQWLMMGGIFASLALIGYLSELPLWQAAIVLISSMAAVLVSRLIHIPLVHLTQPPLTQPLTADWQLLMATSQGDALWRGHLLQARDCGVAIVLTFAIYHPLKRSINRTLFYDQTSAAAWHQLKVLAQLSKPG